MRLGLCFNATARAGKIEGREGVAGLASPPAMGVLTSEGAVLEEAAGMAIMMLLVVMEERLK